MKTVLSFIFILISIKCFAQFSKTHYIPPLISAVGLVQDHYLYISTPNSSDVNFKIIAIGGGIINGKVSRTTPYKYTIGSGENTQLFTPFSQPGIVQNKGYIIEAEDLVYVSTRTNATWEPQTRTYNHAGGLVSKGNSALGKEFRLGAMINPLPDPSVLNFASILSTENNTQITISNIPNGTKLIDGTIVNGPITTTLNKNESYVLALANYPNDTNSPPTNSSKMIGALVSTDKPVAVTSGSFGGSNSSVLTARFPQGRDLGFDQIVPVEKTGIEYVFIKGLGTDELERPLLIAHYDNTQVFINGSSTAYTTLNAGEHIVFDGSNFINGNLYVTTDKNVFAYQSIGGSTNAANQNLCFVPPIKCTTPNTVDNIPFIQSIGDVAFNVYLNIVTETGATVHVNGSPITVSPVSITGNSQLVRYTLEGVSGNTTVQSTKQVYVSYFGSNDAATYGGYYSGFDLKPEIALDKIVATGATCIPNVILKISSLSSYNDFQWYKNDNPIPGAISNTYTPTLPGFYHVKASIINCINDVLSDKIPVSECATNFDNDLANDNIDIDYDNDGILNCTESYGTQNLDLSNPNSGTVTIETYSNSFWGSITTTASSVPTPFTGSTDSSFVTELPAGIGSSVGYQLIFSIPINLSLEYVTTANPSDLLNTDAEYIVNSDIDKTITVLNPTNQLLIDTNYDGVYESDVTQFSSFEIRFRLNGSVPLPAGTGTFKFQSYQTSFFKITHTNLSDTSGNKSTFKLVATCIPNDSDGDLIVDQIDLDSDNDGIPDSIENQNIPKPLSNTDTNLDGLDNAFEPPRSPLDSDGDSISNYLDLDSDNDGIYDLVESGSNAPDSNQNGIIESVAFGINGLANILETTPGSGILNYTVSDTDNDGIKNHIELDSDNDECSDVIEARFTDPNSDGMLGNTPISVDSNGIVTSGTDGYTTPNTNYIIATPIIITTQPADQFICLHQNANFTITSNADDYQWEISTDGLTWTPITNDATYSGATTASLVITNIDASMHKNRYQVILNKTNNACGLTSDRATLNTLALPTLNSPVSIVQCDNNNDGITNFNITQKNNFISTNYTNEVFTYYTTLAGANSKDNVALITNPIAFTSSTGSIWARVENTNECFSVAEIQLTVSNSQIDPNFKKLFGTCDDYIDPVQNDKDGIATFNFSSITSDIQAILPPPSSDYSIQFYTNDADALSETNPISNISNYRNAIAPQQQIWARVDTNSDNSCYGLGTYITLQVNPKPDIDTNAAHTDDDVICANLPSHFVQLNAGIQDGSPTSDYTYIWTKDGITVGGATAPTLDVNTAGIYTVEVVNTHGCSRTRIITVTASDIATINSIVIVDLSTDSNTVEVQTTGPGNYEYSIDLPHGPFQDSNFFENVPAGIHTMYINDKNSCGMVQKTIAVLGAPKFFSPNNDGFNDYWNIKGANDTFNKGASVFIYDRYGKLITQLFPTSNGWDGTFKGNPLPADDYWYTVKLEDGREAKGHFSLKR